MLDFLATLQIKNMIMLCVIFSQPIEVPIQQNKQQFSISAIESNLLTRLRQSYIAKLSGYLVFTGWVMDVEFLPDHGML